MKIIESVKSFGIGWLIALAVLLLMVVSLFFGGTISPFQVKLLFLLLALAILL